MDLTSYTAKKAAGKVSVSPPKADGTVDIVGLTFDRDTGLPDKLTVAVSFLQANFQAHAQILTDAGIVPPKL